MKKVVFYHSMICPRCRWASLQIAALLPDFPHLEIERVEYLTHLGDARRSGVRGIPTLVSGEAVLTGFVLTRSRIRAFFESLA